MKQEKLSRLYRIFIVLYELDSLGDTPKDLSLLKKTEE